MESIPQEKEKLIVQMLAIQNRSASGKNGEGKRCRSLSSVLVLDT